MLSLSGARGELSSSQPYTLAAMFVSLAGDSPRARRPVAKTNVIGTLLVANIQRGTE